MYAVLAFLFHKKAKKIHFYKQSTGDSNITIITLRIFICLSVLSEQFMVYIYIYIYSEDASIFHYRIM